MAGILNREALLAALAPRIEDVAITLPDGSPSTIRMRSMTAAERIAIGVAMGKADTFDTAQFSARVIIATAIDEAGQPLMTEADVPTLLGGNTAVFEPLFDAAQRLNGLGVASQAAAKGN